MKSKLILMLLGLLSLFFGSWAGAEAFKDTAQPISTMALMGMMGYLFHALVIFMSLTFPAGIRRKLTLLILAWHIPETILIAIFGMGIPEDTQLSGIVIHSTFSGLALLSWYLDKKE